MNPDTEPDREPDDITALGAGDMPDAEVVIEISELTEDGLENAG